eukprot:4183745-Alexandrium_andersonii.AAC.1
MASNSAALAPSTAASRAPPGSAGTSPAARACSAGRVPSPCRPQHLHPSAVIRAAATMKQPCVA